MGLDGTDDLRASLPPATLAALTSAVWGRFHRLAQRAGAQGSSSLRARAHDPAQFAPGDPCARSLSLPLFGKSGLYTVEARGTTLVIAGGIAEAEPEPEHLPRLARLARALQAALVGSEARHYERDSFHALTLPASGSNVKSRRPQALPGLPLRASIGLHAGLAYGGVIGNRAPRYKIWGDALQVR